MELGFFGAALAGGGTTAILLAIAGFLGRSQLAHWLNKDIERVKAEFQRDLQRDKASFERELEAYKVSLIAEAERAKAAQSVKTAGAMKIIELKFEALSALNIAVRDLASFGIAQCATAYRTPENALQHYSQASARLDAASAAVEKAAAFIPHQEYQMLLHLHYVLLQAVGDRGAQVHPLSAERMTPLRDELIPLQAEVQRMVMAHLHAMMQMA